MPGIYFIKQEKQAEVDGKKTIADYAKELKIVINMSCGGVGKCGKCRVKVNGIVSEKNEKEKAHELAGEYRLACQAVPAGETYVGLSEAKVRLKSIQPRNIKIDKKEGFGIALDIGTTTLAAYLIDTETGGIVKERSEFNPQRAYGEDVITRIGNKSIEVYKSLKNGINDILADLLNNNEFGEPIETKVENIHSIYAVSNPAMHHFFLGYEVTSLGVAPFQPVSKKSNVKKANELGLEWLEPDTIVYTPPLIAGFIGSDVLAGILASQLFRDDKPSMLIDFGTNGEIVLSDGRKIISASCAMGPAFEGGRIKHGNISKPGAIEKVKIVDGKISYSTIDDEEPASICGTGIVDLVAELYRTGLIDKRGMMSRNEREIKLTENILFSRKDISEVQLAKAAVQTCIEILLEEADLSLGDLNVVYIAGAFGNYLNCENARRIGLIPNIPLDKIKNIGNAAGEGAREMLLSESLRKQAEKIAEQIDYLELMDKKYNFNDKYMNNMYF